MSDMKKKILEWREMAEKDPQHSALLTDSANRLEKIYKARMRALPRISEAGRKKLLSVDGELKWLKNRN